MRDFTVEGAMAELDRQTQERKDRGVADVVPSGVRSPARGGSLDSVRSPVSARSPHLGNVPEHAAFAIGDDEDEDDADDTRRMSSSTTFSAPLSATSSVVDDAVPMQSRSMSEKARGKQPVGQGSFSRSTSRNTSTTSLPALITANTNTSTNSFQTQFRPTSEWVSALYIPGRVFRLSILTANTLAQYLAAFPAIIDHKCPHRPCLRPSKSFCLAHPHRRTHQLEAPRSRISDE